MPQMAPLNWLTLFLFFIMMFLFYNIYNYFNFNYSTKKIKFMKKSLLYNWKW
uniref:ATP synthase complex subunit 8 n=1 Tax=Lamiinae sp. 1 ACP-2013 TaxID=1434531 RepID=A0A3G5FNI0_9CUCU|nr:ATP synthase F0 subunit 8 [Lamiinae sp. 1 ACP-2013]